MNFKIFCSIGFSLAGLVFSIIILALYLSKSKKKYFEGELFKAYLIINIISCLVEIASIYSIAKSLPYYFEIVLAKLHPFFMIMRLFLIIGYIISVIAECREKKLPKYIYYIIITLMVLYLMPLTWLDFNISNNGYIFDSGNKIITYMVGVLYILTAITVVILFIFGKLRKNEILPLIYAMIVISIASVSQLCLELDANFQNFLLVLLSGAFYFTTENQDIKLIDELKEKRIEAEEANDAQTKFLSNMSHEIRTPMNTIIGFSDVLLEEPELTSEKTKKYMEYIHESSISLLELVNNILDISRIESNREELIEKEYRLQDLVFDINSIIEAKMKSQETTFNINIDENLPTVLKGDPQKLTKILVNILRSAVFYTSYGKIDFNIKKEVREDDLFSLEIEVANTGHALQVEDFNFNFTDFMRLGTENGKTIDSIKLGLMCAKEYADMLGTKIEFINAPGQGTRYKLKLVQEVIDDTPCGDIFAHGKDNIEHKLFDLSGKRVIVVDDSSVNLKLASRLLEPYKLTIDTVQSGNECIEKVKNNRYDMIFLDHMMPNMDGVTTLKILKSSVGYLPPVIALTANSYNGAQEKYEQIGFNGYLAKPISYRELNKVLYKYLYNNETKEISTNQNTNMQQPEQPQKVENSTTQVTTPVEENNKKIETLDDIQGDDTI